MRTLSIVLGLALIVSCGGNLPPIPQDCRLFGCGAGFQCEEQEDGTYACVEIPPCEETGCPEGEVCDDGSCRPATCADVGCPEGQVCGPDLICHQDNCPYPDWPWCNEVGQKCSSPESPCKTNPSDDPYYCEEAIPCQDPLPQPQCETFTDRGGTVRVRDCDCYVGDVWEPCEVDPPPEGCSFPQGLPEDAFTGTSNPGTFGSAVNKVMAELTGCAVGSDCPVTFHPDIWMGMVEDKLRELGLCAGRHKATPPGASDQISVKGTDFCDGRKHENYKVYNYGGGKVIWAPHANQDGWYVDCGEVPPGQCGAPHPDLTRMKFNCGEHNGILDCTWITVGQPEYCAEIGMCCMPGTGPCGAPGCIARGGCPVRPEGHEEREPCEAELCDQKWECNGEPVPGWRGNPAQSNCRGHWKTWCSALGSTAEAEGVR